MVISSLIAPAAAGALSAVLGTKALKSGYHDLGVVFYAGTAVSIYFCVHDYKRRSADDYKTNLVARRRAEFDEKNTPYVVKLISSLNAQISMEGDNFKFMINPMLQQQLVMREVQTGETLLGQGDKTKALERFSCAAVLSSLAGPVSKGENLIATVSRMLPDLAAVLQKQFVADYDATKAHLRKLVAAQPPAQPALTREEMLASLQAAPAGAAVPAAVPAPVDTLEEDSIDDSDEEKEDIQVPEPKEEAKVEEVVEESKEEVVEEPAQPSATEIEEAAQPVIEKVQVQVVPVVAAAPVEQVTQATEVTEVVHDVQEVEEVKEAISEPVDELEEPISTPEILTDSAFQEQSTSVKEDSPQMDDDDLE